MSSYCERIRTFAAKSDENLKFPPTLNHGSGFSSFVGFRKQSFQPATSSVHLEFSLEFSGLRPKVPGPCEHGVQRVVFCRPPPQQLHSPCTRQGGRSDHEGAHARELGEERRCAAHRCR
eukprot:1197015-Rhodomonas_salina.5